jgi:hypothetical protein
MRLDDWIVDNFGQYGLEVTAAVAIHGAVSSRMMRGTVIDAMWGAEVQQTEQIRNRRYGHPEMCCVHDYWMPAHHLTLGTDLPDGAGHIVRVDVEFYFIYCTEAGILYWYQEGNSGN